MTGCDSRVHDSDCEREVFFLELTLTVIPRDPRRCFLDPICNVETEKLGSSLGSSSPGSSSIVTKRLPVGVHRTELTQNDTLGVNKRVLKVRESNDHRSGMNTLFTPRTPQPAHAHCRARRVPWLSLNVTIADNYRGDTAPELKCHARAWGWCSRGASSYR